MDWLDFYSAISWQVVVGVFLAIIGYVYLYRWNQKFALLVLGAIIIALVYFEADWSYWDRYFKVEWSMGRYR